jgi:hypothetical protein
MTKPLTTALTRPYVHVLFGARQTGKSTLLRSLLKNVQLWLDLSDPEWQFAVIVRRRLSALTGRRFDPGLCCLAALSP